MLSSFCIYTIFQLWFTNSHTNVSFKNSSSPHQNLNPPQNLFDGTLSTNEPLGTPVHFEISIQTLVNHAWSINRVWRCNVEQGIWRRLGFPTLPWRMLWSVSIPELSYRALQHSRHSRLPAAGAPDTGTLSLSRNSPAAAITSCKSCKRLDN